MTKDNDILVFITRRDATCAECGAELGRHAWIALDIKRCTLWGTPGANTAIGSAAAAPPRARPVLPSSSL
jgi:hypothetical protein